MPSICKSNDYKLTAVNHYLSKIPKDKYKNIFKGAYERPEKYVAKNKKKKVKKNYL